MLEQWGSVDGDGNADAIIRDRRDGRRATYYAIFWNFTLVAGFAIWYAITQISAALALEIIAASWLAISGINRAVHETHTMLMIAERRTQLIEQKLRDFQIDLSDIVRGR